MDIRKITDGFSAAPQLTPDALSEIAALGFRTVVCNRPDSEITPDLQSDAMREAAEQAGLAFHVLEVGRDGLTPELIAGMKEVLDNAPGPVLSYCRTGTRSTFLWSAAMAGKMPSSDIIAAAQAGGYDVSGLRAFLDAAQ